MRLSSRALAATALVSVAALTACSGGGGTSAEPATSGAAGSVSIENCGRTLTFDEKPSRVLLLGFVSVAEVSAFVELGIEDSIIANMQRYGVSDDPSLVERIAALPDGGLTINENFGPPAEQVLALQPDLVVSTTAVGFDKNLGFATRDELADAGIASFITPARCADGNPDATDEERARYDSAGIDGSFELIKHLGTIFGVEDRADEVVARMQASLDETASALQGVQTVSGIVISPGHVTDAPMAWTGGIVDDVLRRAGVENVFGGLGTRGALDISAEQLAAARPDVVVTFTDSSVDAGEFARQISERFPDWPGIERGAIVAVHDGAYLGTTNDEAVAKIARVAHPDAF